MSDKPLDVVEFYRDKVILVTGCTGFVGKIMLEKLLRSTDFKRVYVMIRNRQGSTLKQRLEKEIFSSFLFMELFRKHPEKIKVARERIVPIAGNLSLDELGLKSDLKATLIEELNVIIGCAATINFSESLHDAIQTNYLGPVRMMDLAFQCKNLVSFAHVSTAFVDGNTPNGSYFTETIREMQGEVEQVMADCLKMDPV